MKKNCFTFNKFKVSLKKAEFGIFEISNQGIFVCGTSPEEWASPRAKENVLWCWAPPSGTTMEYILSTSILLDQILASRNTNRTLSHGWLHICFLFIFTHSSSSFPQTVTESSVGGGRYKGKKNNPNLLNRSTLPLSVSLSSFILLIPPQLSRRR